MSLGSIGSQGLIFQLNKKNNNMTNKKVKVIHSLKKKKYNSTHIKASTKNRIRIINVR